MFTCKNGHKVTLRPVVGAFRPIVCPRCLVKGA